MADKPSTSRVGRPRSRSASQTPKGTAKVGRPRSKSAQKPKVKGSTKKAKRAVRPIFQLELDTIQINTRQFGDQLPDLPPIDLEQDNIPLNPPNQPQNLPVGEDKNQQHQVAEPNLPPKPEELEQPNPPYST